MGTVFTLWMAWVARVPNSFATGIEFNREPNFRHPAEERAVMQAIYRSSNSLLSDCPLSVMKKLTKIILNHHIYFIPSYHPEMHAVAKMAKNCQPLAI